jgi:hypothetical protein
MLRRHLLTAMTVAAMVIVAYAAMSSVLHALLDPATRALA